MVESAEGIGSRKWSLDREGRELARDDPSHSVRLMEGTKWLASLTHEGEAVLHLLVTAPQLWGAANDLVKLIASGREAMGSAEATALANTVAKAVGKDDWRQVLQSEP